MIYLFLSNFLLSIENNNFTAQQHRLPNFLMRQQRPSFPFAIELDRPEKISFHTFKFVAATRRHQRAKSSQVKSSLVWDQHRSLNSGLVISTMRGVTMLISVELSQEYRVQLLPFVNHLHPRQVEPADDDEKKFGQVCVGKS